MMQSATRSDGAFTEGDEDASPPDHGLVALVMMLRLQGLAVDLEQLRHQLGRSPVGVPEMLRCAKEFGLKARVVRSSWNRLPKTPMPALAVLAGSRYLIIGNAGEEKIVVLEPGRSEPFAIARADLERIWDGSLLLMTKRASLSSLAQRFDITWFLSALHKYRWLLSEVLAISLFLQLLGLVGPLFFQVVVDKVLVHRSMATLDVIVLGLLAVAIFEAILGGLRSYLFSHTTNRIDVELGARLFRHLVALPISYFESRRVGDSIARIRELENIRNFITSSALTVAVDVLFAFVFVAVLFFYSSYLAWIVVASLPVYVGVSAGVTPLFQRRLDEKFRRGAENQAFLVESVTGIETLKAAAVEPQMQRQWEEQLAGYVTASFRVTNLANVASQAVQLTSKVVAALVLYFGAKLVIAGDLTVGELVAFNLLASRVSAPILRLAQTWQDFHQARLSIARLGDILNSATEPIYRPGRLSLGRIRGELLFERVSFRYRVDGPKILHDVTLHVPAGQVVGIVGPSGSGKSTLAKLLQRLYIAEGGRILVDDVDLAQVDPAWLRRQIGVVLQDSVLFNRSVRDNIALADPGLSAERVVAAATLSGAHDFILGLPEGYDTIVGERGSNLSGGQRQRIAIARALITDPRILVFDEATSALDYESESVILQNMGQMCQDRTVLIIAHRISALRTADRIVTVDNGSIVEDGPHEGLVRAGGRYAAMFRQQVGLHERI